ncbi:MULTISPECIES: ABC transporter substrate-binding protein [Shewanella]|uniref:ABC transporter substrate-binding protein n=1 Tax=unclassified Shewanella TaxID=196818 RepID=UPI0015862F77|nr:ABC transporter substrate-binding protein [Shewanella sp. MEBiC00475]
MNIFLLAFMLIGVTSCDLGASQSFTTSAQKDLIKIAVSGTPLSSPFFIAQQQGYFEKNGLNVELVRFDSGVKCFDALKNKQVDLATASETVVMFNSFKQANFTVLASFVESDNDLKLLSLTPQKYHQLDNLAHARVGIVKSSASEFFFDSLLIMYNKTQQPIERVYLPAEQLIPALLNHQVDMISAWEPFGYLLTQQISSNPQVINSRGLHHLSFNLLELKDTSLTTTEKLAILKAINDATDYIHSHSKLAQGIISNTLLIEPSQLHYSWDDYTFRLSLSNALFSNIQTQSQWAIDNQLVAEQNSLDFRQVFDRQLLEKFMNLEAGW